MDVFQALADPTRRAILGMLVHGERSAGQIGAAFDITPPAVSQHLRGLRLAGLVRVRAEAQKRIYQLIPDGFDRIGVWLSMTRPLPAPEAVPSPRLPLKALVEARHIGAAIM